MNPTSSTVLVTGGCGYIGRQLALHLLALGHHLVVVDDLSTGLHPDVWLKDAISERRTEGGRIVFRLGHKPDVQALTLTLLPCDLSHGLRQLQAAGASPRFAAVYHLAGPKLFAAHIAREPLTVAAKLAIDGAFFAWAQAHKQHIARLVYVSPRDVEHGASPVTVAADAGEALALMAARSCGINTATVRLCSLYGKDQSAQAWLPALAHQVLRAGDTLALPKSAAQPRHVLHIDDAVQALLYAAEHASDGVPVTLGAPTAVTLLHIASVLTRLRERPLTLQPEALHSDVAPAAQDQVRRGWAAVHYTPAVQLDTALPQVMRAALRREQLKLQQVPVAAAMQQRPQAPS